MCRLCTSIFSLVCLLDTSLVLVSILADYSFWTPSGVYVLHSAPRCFLCGYGATFCLSVTVKRVFWLSVRTRGCILLGSVLWSIIRVLMLVSRHQDCLSELPIFPLISAVYFGLLSPRSRMELAQCVVEALTGQARLMPSNRTWCRHKIYHRAFIYPTNTGDNIRKTDRTTNFDTSEPHDRNNEEERKGTRGPSESFFDRPPQIEASHLSNCPCIFDTPAITFSNPEQTVSSEANV
jgi:hypothetical protein